LNNLYAYALEQSPKTPEIILELSGLLRYMLYECQEKFVSLSKEVGQLENFINLSQLQLEERGEVKFTTSGQENDFKVAPLLLSVFVENAFKHSLSSVSEDILIDINLDISDEGKLDFLCKNTFSETTNNESLSKGIGLDNVKKRLEILYPKAHTLEISTTKDLYKVRLSLQLQKLD
jgi:LytS/YehU family sensor histidine kinase